ncbi:MAG: hypothetical protein IIU58_01980, partial [Clostridia bacterium]|nr:hypothetical protein [Clostridia bacterium]
GFLNFFQKFFALSTSPRGELFYSITFGQACQAFFAFFRRKILGIFDTTGYGDFPWIRPQFVDSCRTKFYI